jgi:tRNA-specific 2-thiouridylase
MPGMRIVVAMSGGVDSSVVAGMLAEAGHDVIGITLQLYDHGAATGRKGACCAGQDIHDARSVAAKLGIPHYVIDAEARFREAVINDFAASYAAGVTPIPCVRCNQGPKFHDLLGMAKDLGAAALATGHYVRRIEGPHGAELHRAADPARDQSWFLFATTRAQLDFCRFPLGDMPNKDAVRAIAARLDLPVAEKPDSQDICFVPQGSYADLVGRLRPDALEPGDIVSNSGELLGRHTGLARFTVGQSKRLGIAAGPNGEKRVVVALDPASRRVIVGPATSGTRHIHLRDMNWLIDPPPPAALRCAVKLRARDTLRPATIHPSPDGAEVLLDEPALPAPGQGCVLYNGDHVLGGGFILRPAPAEAA